MKIIIFGHRGWIGNLLVDLIKKENIEYVLTEIRANNRIDVEKLILEEKPSHIISVIGRTHGIQGGKVYQTIDYLEQKGKINENIRDNLYSPMVLAILCARYNVHLTYFGTGCIFSQRCIFSRGYRGYQGYPGENESIGFTEDDSPNFFGSAYSTVKGYTDELMHLFDETVLNLRIRMPISSIPHPRNFITKITTYDKICSIPNSMTVLDELLPIIIDMLKKGVTGTFNMTNPGQITHNEILEMYKEIIDSRFTWENFSPEEQDKILDAPRSNNFLDTTKLQKLYPDLKHIKESVRQTLISMKEKIPSVNILVTGGCGFIGSHFINLMAKKYWNYNFINLDCLYYCANEENIDLDLLNSSRYVLIKEKVQDADLLSILSKYNIHYLIHFSAQTNVDNSFRDQMSFIDDNIIGTYKLLEASRHYMKLKKFILVSTDEVYGDYTIHNKKEESRLEPTNPYSASKASVEMFALSYMHSFNLPIIITRGNNCYGSHQFEEKLVPLFIKLLFNNQKCTIHGQGKSQRTFIHVNDTVNAFDTILHKGLVGEIYNIGSYDKMSILELTKILISKIKKTDKYDDWIEYVSDRPHNDAHYNINFDKLIKLGWDPQISFDEGIDQTIKWYADMYSKN